MINFKQVLLLIVIAEAFIYIIVTISNAFLPDNPKPLTTAEIDIITTNCPQCAAPMYEAGMIEPNR